VTEPADQDPNVRGDFNQTISFFRIMPEYTHKFSETSVGRAWLGIGQDMTLLDVGSIYYRFRTNVFSQRLELETRLATTWKAYLGIENVGNWTQEEFQVPYRPGEQSGNSLPFSESPLITATSNYSTDTGALYMRNVLHEENSPWTFLPGLRLSYYNLTHESIPEPRLGLRYAVDESLTLRAATGLYDEAPPVEYSDSNYGNPSLTSQLATHYTVGFEKDFRQEKGGPGWVWSTDLFYKQLFRLVQTTANLNSSGQPEFYDNEGSGRIYGAEVMLKYQSMDWTGWLAYTLSRSLRTYPPSGESIYQYDQTHNLIVVAERPFGKNWKFSGRFRYTTGDPYTPKIGGDFDVDNDVYLPLSGGIYSARMPPFWEFDIRFDRKWIFDQWILTAYLDIENVTNHRSVEQINYSYNFQQQANVTGLPFLPTLGIKGEY
ncbi:MAG: hypothetical protein C5B49_09620, partial [Bdellovibrio sp.]